MELEHQEHYTITVNGRAEEWHEDTISYQQVVDLAFDGNPPGGDNVTFTVRFKIGDKEGFLGPSSKPIKVEEGMEFRVKHSTRS